MEIKWDKGDTVYFVKVNENGVYAEKKASGDGTIYEVNNSTWIYRGYGITDSENIEKSEANKFIKEISAEMKEAEDETGDVKKLFEKVKAFVSDKKHHLGSVEKLKEE